jgi:hypothetical protein
MAGPASVDVLIESRKVLRILGRGQPPELRGSRGEGAGFESEDALLHVEE